MREVSGLPTDRVSRLEHRKAAEALAATWVDDLRSALEHRFGVPPEVLKKYAEHFKRLFVLSRPNNQKRSYVEVLRAILKDSEDDLVLHVQQFDGGISNPAVSYLEGVVGRLPEEERDYMDEALGCLRQGYRRAALVLAWCAVMDRIHRKIEQAGFDQFNRACASMKGKSRGRFKRFNKTFDLSTLNELQDVPDNDVILVLEGMRLLDGAQGDRLRSCYRYRCQAAHPGAAPLGDPNLAAFLHDVELMVFANPEFAL